MNWHDKIVGPLTYFQADQFLKNSLGNGYRFPRIKELQEVFFNHTKEFKPGLYWAIPAGNTHAWYVDTEDMEADTIKKEKYCYFRAIKI